MVNEHLIVIIKEMEKAYRNWDENVKAGLNPVPIQDLDYWIQELKHQGVPMIYEKYERMATEIKYPDKKQPTATFRLAQQKYHEERQKIYEQFKLALFDEYGVINNPKREKCFAMAWERGHSSGFREVESEFMDLVELIK